MRLQKFLSQAGCCSRRQGEKLIVSGRVKVNGQVVQTLGTKIDPNKDKVECDGRQLHLSQKRIYIALNKPVGYVTSCKHPGDNIVMSLINIPERVYPIGRLDKDSEGLLLLTNDGNLHHRLSHPSFQHEKEYVVTVAHPISDESLTKLKEGVTIDGYTTQPATIVRLSDNCFQITLREGKNRQIRRMVEAVGNYVIHLKRIRVSSIHLGKLKVGKWRYLTKQEEINLIKNLS